MAYFDFASFQLIVRPPIVVVCFACENTRWHVKHHDTPNNRRAKIFKWARFDGLHNLMKHTNFFSVCGVYLYKVEYFFVFG